MPDDKDKRAPAATTGTDAVAAEPGQPTEGTPSEAPSAPATGSAKRAAAAPTCPTCRGTLAQYTGEAAHKRGSFWCHACGVRHRLPATTDPATPAPSSEQTQATR